MGRGNYTKPSAGAQVVWTHPLARGLAAGWLFNSGEINDYAQFGANGVNNSTSMGVGKFGGGARSFISASTQFISVGTPPRLNLSSALTYLLWIKPTSFSAVSTYIGQSNTGATLTQGYFYSQGTGFLGLAQAGTLFTVSTTPITLGVWQQIAVTRAGVAGAWTANYFINGVLISSPTLATDPSVQQSFSIGRPGAFNGAYANSLIDHALVYSRALSAQEVAWLYREPFAMIQSSPIRRTYFIAPQGGGWIIGSPIVLPSSVISPRGIIVPQGVSVN